MRVEIYSKIQSDKHYLMYIRKNPNWYKELSRYPEKFKEFEKEYEVK